MANLNYSRPHMLKKEALPFFKEDLARLIMTPDEWKKHYNIDENALVEIKEPYISYGISDREGASSLCGWSNLKNKDGGSTFHFSIHFPSMEMRQHDKFSKGRLIRDFMSRLQTVADQYFQQFIIENK